MHYSVYLGLLFAALFGVVGPYVAGRVSPRSATWLITTGGLISGLSALGAMFALGVTLVGQAPSVAAQGHWSAAALRSADPVRFPVAVIALGGVALALGRTGYVAIHWIRLIATRRRASRVTAAAGEDIVVLPSPELEAYAIPGRPGRIFITKGMLRLLDADERRVVIAHERSHLSHRHDLHRAAASVALALNPLLAALPRVQEWSTERWADEDAAGAGDRATVARALRKACASPTSNGQPQGSLAVAASAVDRRLAALQLDPVRPHPAMLVAAGVVVTLSALGTLDAVTDLSSLLHFAHTAHFVQLRRLIPGHQ
jgi:hypothetical protein